MPADDTKAADKERADELEAQAAFDSGVEAEAPTKPAPKPEATTEKPAAPASAATPREKAPAKPEYVQVTKQDLEELRAAAKKTADHEGQFSKAFGTIGNMQKMINAIQAATPAGFKVEIPKDAFAGMERDFPELAAHSRTALEAAFRGLTGTAPASAGHDPEQFQQRITESVAKLRVEAEIEALTDDHPDWATIVGRVDTTKGQQPDPNNPYRKWLATKDPAYQARLNGTNRAAVISRSIDRFLAETKARVPSLKEQAQAARIQGAVRPRGDGGQPAPGRTDDDEFAAGFASG